ncbi:MAG: hypothetical protein JWL59_5121 [Chthoniobacteraceae bacterium]|nr:hypothetical protein [Chthoniobacteraceae bacterium]
MLVKGRLGSAGEIELEKKETIPVENPERWQFKPGSPSWLAGVYGDVGVNGDTSHISLGVDTILRHVDFTAAFEGEARKGRFGIENGFLYLGLSDNVGTGGMLSSVDVQVNEYLIDFSLSWRVVDTPRGWLDLLLGTRYTNLYQEIALHRNDDSIEAESARLVDAASDQIRDRLLGILSNGRFRERIRAAVDARLSDDLEILEGRKPVLPIGPLGAAAADRLKARIRSIIEERAAQIASSLRGRARMSEAEVRRRVDASKADLERAISRTLKRTLGSTYSKSNDWFDPYIGFRARYNLSNAFYLTGRGDIGGFGVGSDLTWQVYGALGCQLSKRVFAEAGYRCLFVNYRHDGLIYEVYTRGAQLTLGILF